MGALPWAGMSRAVGAEDPAAVKTSMISPSVVMALVPTTTSGGASFVLSFAFLISSASSGLFDHHDLVFGKRDVRAGHALLEADMR